MKLLPISSEKLSQLKQETYLDPEFTAVRKCIENSCPATRSEVPAAAAKFWFVRDQLTVVEDIIMKDERLVIPRTMQKLILTNLHASHLGMDKTKQRARSIVYWPGMNRSVEGFILKCDAFCIYQRSNPKEPLLQHEIPTYPWEYVGVDLFYEKNEFHMATVDYYSKFIEIDYLGLIALSVHVIDCLKCHFVRHGIPRLMTTDNGPQFSAETFKKFGED
jgi:hypothetical protein